MISDTQPIGVFDSGIGGLSVLKHLMHQLPNERFVYLGDTARVPYGNKSAQTVAKYTRQCADFLLQHNVKMIVIACNTASALAMDELRAALPVPVIGVIEPAARIAVERTRNGHIGVIGTRALVSSDSYATAIASHAQGKRVFVHSQPCPLFVPLVEEGWLDKPATELIAREYLGPLVANGIDTLVLGCTHYPLLTPLLSRLLPEVTLVDCGASTTADVAVALGIEPTPQPLDGSDVYFYLTDHTPTFPILARQFLGVTVNEPVRVTVDQTVGA